MKTSTWVWILVVIVIIGGGVWYYMSMGASSAAVDQNAQSTDQTVTQTPDQTATTSTPAQPAVPMTATVTYDGTSFSPSTVTIAQGGTVTFTDTAGSMWVASNPHPTHEGYDGTTRAQHCVSGYTGAAPFDQCVQGSTFNFTFTKTGSWGYHDHLNHGATGTVVVQ